MHRSWGKSVQIRPATSIERNAMNDNDGYRIDFNEGDYKITVYFENGKWLKLHIPNRIDFSEFSKSRHFILRADNKELLIDMDKVLFIEEEQEGERDAEMEEAGDEQT